MSKPSSGIQCTVRQFRQRMGWTQEELAKKLNIRRQAVYEMETGKYLPNTGVALQIAALFSCRVEDLFVVRERAALTTVTLMEEPVGGEARLLLGRVRDLLVGMPMKPGSLGGADGVINEKLNGKTRAEVLIPQEMLEKSLIILGCDPALDLLNDHLRRLAPASLTHAVFASSRKALDVLAAGHSHAAAIHFHNAGEDEANVVEAERALSAVPCRILAFASNEEGLMVGSGNPKKIRSVDDLARPDVRFVNREPGAALRRLLHGKLAEKNIPEEEIGGFTEEVRSHAEGALRVLGRSADAALGVRMVAHAYGLDFVPLAVTRCDLVIPLDLEENQAVKALLDILQTSTLRRDMEALPGYDSTVTGREIALLT